MMQSAAAAAARQWGTTLLTKRTRIPSWLPLPLGGLVPTTQLPQHRMSPRACAFFSTTPTLEHMTNDIGNKKNKTNKNKKNAILRVHGRDRRGIVAAVSQVLDQFGCGIQKSEHWIDNDAAATANQAGLFFQRTEFSRDYENNDTDNNHEGVDNDETQQQHQAAIEAALAQVGGTELQCRVNWRQRRTRMAIFVSKYDHCLWELLLRHEAHEFSDDDCDIVAVLSNHNTLQHVADTFQIPFYVFDMSHNKQAAEQAQLRLLQDELQVDFIVLARYMQVLSSDFLQHWPTDCILNIHHSFLPAFAGGSPYHQAHRRGVKIIGATAHYVTQELDAGPIVEQDVVHVSHRDTVARMRQKGRIIERNVLTRAVRAHLEDRVIYYQNRCVVFGD